ncbi:glycosyltransferase [Flavobacterium sp.]|uniref:glycosyltransferase n=1 Tax=Flavobacterium sp. TaxID=239 RepID=UPI00374D0B4E
MVKIAFLLNYPTSYKAAINYFRNLFYAIDKHLQDKVEIILYVPDNIENEYLEIYSPYAKIIKTDILRRNSLSWFIDKIGQKSFDKNILLEKLLIDSKIDIVSHSSFISKKIKTINWIMDFQHNHFYNLWTDKELQATKKFLDRLIMKSDGIFLSSDSAFQDYKTDYLNESDKVNILHFVCQPQQDISKRMTESEEKELLDKYNINRPFFYLPNQFWSHKNHMVVFKAIKKLKDQGYNPLLITSGLMHDFRKKMSHITDLQSYVKDNNLKSNIFLLGLIPYQDVLSLITLSACVINPSLFEGWSSTVEESKTMGKRLILSDIQVHREQNPEFGFYFDPLNTEQLSILMEKVINDDLKINSLTQEELNVNLQKRTKKFANDFLNGVRNVLDKK